MKYLFNDAQKEIIKKVGYDPDKDYDDNEVEEFVEKIADYLMDHGFDKDYVANEIGNICEDIITILTK
jgi:hypothetical protein